MRYYDLINQFLLMIVMMFFIFICLCAAATTAVVLMLKKNNERHRQQLADYEQHLPVLTVDLNALPIDTEDQLTESEPAFNSKPETVITAPATLAATHWKDQVRSFRDAGSYEEAIVAADPAWPQWLYYEQVAITIRAAVREHKKGAPAQTEYWLANLYKVAAQASLVHDKPHSPDSDPQEPLSSREQLNNVELPYAGIGVDKLRLLTKTDKKQMQELWGDPNQHVTAFEWLQQQN